MFPIKPRINLNTKQQEIELFLAKGNAVSFNITSMKKYYTIMKIKVDSNKPFTTIVEIWFNQKAFLSTTHFALRIQNKFLWATGLPKIFQSRVRKLTKQNQTETRF